MSTEVLYILKMIDQMMAEYNVRVKSAMESGYPLGGQLVHERMTALKLLRDKIEDQYK